MGRRHTAALAAVYVIRILAIECLCIRLNVTDYDRLWSARQCNASLTTRRAADKTNQYFSYLKQSTPEVLNTLLAIISLMHIALEVKADKFQCALQQNLCPLASYVKT